LRVLVTGVSGQIGRYVVGALSDMDVIGIDVKNPDFSGSIKFVRGDIRDREIVEKVLEGVDLVIHLAASISVEESWKDPLKYVDNNVFGTVNLLHHSVVKGVSKFIYVSSASVYGDPKYLPIDEDHPLNPISPYGASKVAGEIFTLTYSDKISTYIVRPFNVYSEYLRIDDPYSGVIAKFIERISRGLPPIIYGDGLQTRDFIHAEDVARFIRILALDEHKYRVFNIGTGKAVKIRDLAYRLIEISGLKVDPIYMDAREGDIKHSYADISRAVSIGFKPSRNVLDDLEKIYIKYRDV